MAKKPKRAVVIINGKNDLSDVMKRILLKQLENKRKNMGRDNKN